jgi:type I restriction enzyme S subunit
MRAPIGYPTIVGTKLCFNQGCKAFEIKRDFFSDYIYYFLNAGIDVIVSKGNVTTFGELSSYDLGSFHVLMPPLPDQTTIANFLDKKTAKIDTLIEKDKKLIALLKEKRTALINHAVTKGLDPNVKLKDSGIPWIGEIPEGWEVRKASRSFDFIGSGTTPKTQEEIYYDKGDIPWVITGDLNDGLLKETSKRISKEAVRDYSTLKIYPKNSLIIAMYGATIGKTALLDIEACTNQACCVLAKSKIFETKYVFYWFIANKNNIISYSYGGGQPNISQDIIKTLKIPLPPKPEQQKIVEYLDKATSKIDKTIQKIENKTNLLEEYKKSSIHHVVTGKVDVRKSEV